MGSSRAVCLLICLMGFSPSLQADWRSDVSGFFEREDFRGVYTNLTGRFNEIPITDKTTVCGLLAFAAGQSGDRSNEIAWITTYYETYRGGVYILDFLGGRWRSRLVDYFQTWDKLYPLISEMGLIKTAEYSGTTPPRHILMGLEIRNPALYKLKKGELTIEGGLFNRGFNAVSLAASDLFFKSEVHSYVLEIKVDDLVVSKKFDLDIVVFDTPEPSVQSGAISSSIEYSLSLFWDDTLIVTSRKIHEDRVGLSLNLPPGPDTFEPFKVPGQEDPVLHTFSILDAISAVTDLIKGIGKDRDEVTPVPPVRLQTRLETGFIRAQGEGGAVFEIEAAITLRFKDLPLIK